MDYNAFVGGISPGGLTNDFEVKILICFLLLNIESGLTFDQINETLQRTGYVNYFEFTEAMSELRSSKHVIQKNDEENEKNFIITDLGKATSETFFKTLPRTVRDKTVKIAEDILRTSKRNEEISVTYKKVSDGYQLIVSMKDTGTDLMNADIFIPSQKQCELIKCRIYENPSEFYSGMLSLLTGEYKTLQQIAEAGLNKDEF